MPMAGRGERFVRAGYTTPKPLIEIEPNTPMFVKATNSLPLAMMSEIVFVVLREHCERFKFDEVIRRHYSNYNIRLVILDAITSGQAETVALALSDKNKDEQFIIFNGDSAFEDDISPWLKQNALNYDGALQVFKDKDPRWSYARVNEFGEVVETAEKKAISDLASTGLYYFKSSSRYMECYGNLEVCGGERYVAPIFNQMLNAGQRVGVIPCKKYLCFGTPSDFDACRAGKYYSF